MNERQRVARGRAQAALNYIYRGGSATLRSADPSTVRKAGPVTEARDSLDKFTYDLKQVRP